MVIKSNNILLRTLDTPGNCACQHWVTDRSNLWLDCIGFGTWISNSIQIKLKYVITYPCLNIQQYIYVKRRLLKWYISTSSIHTNLQNTIIHHWCDSLYIYLRQMVLIIQAHWNDIDIYKMYPTRDLLSHSFNPLKYYWTLYQYSRQLRPSVSDRSEWCLDGSYSPLWHQSILNNSSR